MGWWTFDDLNGSGLKIRQEQVQPLISREMARSIQTPLS